MSGLVISLKADEKFLVNGALLINGSKRSQIRIGGDDVNVLRLSDALHPDEVKTPVRRVYYAAQIYLSGDAPAKETADSVKAGLASLAHVFESTPLLPQIRKAEKAVEAGRFYSLICALKPLLVLESELLKIALPSICAEEVTSKTVPTTILQSRPKPHVSKPARVITPTRRRETLTLLESPA